MRSRTIDAGAATLAAALFLTACGSGPGESRPVTLKLVAADYDNVGDQGSSQNYWENVAAKFTERHPNIRVKVKVYSWTTIHAKVAAMVKRGDIPDILETNTYADFAADDMLYSADELFSDSTRIDFITSLARAGEVGHVQYGLPFVSSARLHFYNTELFEKAGLDGPPKTWDDVAKYAAKLKAKGVPAPFGLPLAGSEGQGESMMWMLGNGGGFTDELGNYTIDSPDNVATFGWLKENLVKPRLTGGDPAETDRQTVFEDFAKGKVGMLNGHPGLLAEADKAGIKYAVAPIPGKSGPLKSTMGVADWMMAFKKHGHRKEISEFLKFAYSKKNTLAFLEQYSLMPVTVSASDAMRADRKHKELWPFLEKLPTAKFWPIGDPSWTPIVAKIKSDIGKAVTDDPKTVLGRLQQYAEKTTPQAGN